jgi:hypothetical protein
MARKSSPRSPQRDAVLLIDYTNVFGIIAERIDNDQPDAVVLDLIASLKRHVSDHLKLKPVRTLAFANIPPGSTGGHRATGAWLSQGIEPRFCYARSQDGAAALELTMAAMDVSRETGPGTAIVLLSGNQWYMPLVQRLYRNGHFVLMSTLESPTEQEDLPADCQDLYLNAEFLLGGPGRIMDLTQGTDSSLDAAAQRPEETYAIKDEGVLRTLGIIESYFGQYEEIYLTPLLRKLSEVFEDSDEEPKALVNALEEAGAVWLEKRRGFPHNYTVLLMNTEHPDVADIKAEAPGAPDDYDDYDEDDLDDEEYYEDDSVDFDDAEEGVDDAYPSA